MKIETYCKTDTIALRDVGQGDTFLWEDELCIKTDEGTSVSLETGYMYASIAGDALVTPVNAKVVIEQHPTNTEYKEKPHG